MSRSPARSSARRWKQLPDRVRKALEAAGYGPETDFTLKTSTEIRRIPRVGPKACETIRKLYPLRRSLPAKRTPEHGKGQLYAGGVPGNRGGGKRPSELRALFRDDALVARQRILAALDVRRVCQACKRPPMSTEELIRAFSAFSKYGMGEARGIDRDQLGDLLVDLAEDVQAVFPDDERLEELHRRWRARLRNRLTVL